MNAYLLRSIQSAALLALCLLLLCSQARAVGTAPDVVGLVNGNNAFAFDMYARLDRGEGNFVFSPFSISSALAMAYAGAGGETAAHMDKALRFPNPQKAVPPAFAQLLEHMRELRSEDIQIESANALWPSTAYPIRDAYANTLKEYYGSSVTPLDFAGAEGAARAEINRWVSEKTRGKIEKIIEGSLASARLVLVNALYFKGNWQNSFRPAMTKEEPFYLKGGKTVTVPLMKQQSRFNLYADRFMQVVELPYAGDGLSMLVALPLGKKPEALEKAESMLSAERISHWRNSFVRTDVIVLLPRFEITWGAVSLKQALEALGMGGVFDGRADFSGMSDSGGIFLDDVLHKAFIQVNETGTEAAAVTAGIVTASAPVQTLPPALFRADHPFLFFIVDNASGSVLFMGRVMNPKS